MLLMLTEFQKKKIKRLFKFYDSNGNGVIDPDDIDEICQCFIKEFGWEVGSQEDRKFSKTFKKIWRKLIFTVDVNNDGKVDLGEFYLAYESSLSNDANYNKVVKPFIESIFPIIDSDGDNCWTMSDFYKFYRGFRNSTELAKVVFKMMDINTDGVLSKDEVFKHFYDFHMSQDTSLPGNYFFGKLED